MIDKDYLREFVAVLVDDNAHRSNRLIHLIEVVIHQDKMIKKLKKRLKKLEPNR